MNNSVQLEIQNKSYYFCKTSAKNFKLGEKYNEIINNLAGLKSGRHIIFYRIIDSENIEITRILHEKMDLKTRIIEQ
ncbi:MAG: type II toxin-antitoxin system RelE/ParE family toxin [Bacteroidales bacterium]|nr:type II toxin-antitoxin system RelE/ParE family toxin [Bacteroidales bacterium]